MSMMPYLRARLNTEGKLLEFSKYYFPADRGELSRFYKVPVSMLKALDVDFRKQGYGDVLGYLIAKTDYRPVLDDTPLKWLIALQNGKVGYITGSSPDTFNTVTIEDVENAVMSNDTVTNSSRYQKANSSHKRRKMNSSRHDDSVYYKVDEYVGNVIERIFEGAMEDELSVNSVLEYVPEYNADWCLEDYPPEMEKLVNQAMDALKKATMYALFYKAER